MTLLFVGLVNAWEFDNVKSYNPETREVTIINGYGLFETIGKARLNTPLNVNVPMGYQKVAEFDLLAFQDYADALKQFEFSDMNKKEKINRDYDLKYKTFEFVEVDDYKEECGVFYNEMFQDERYYCRYVKNGTKTESREVWKKITPADLKKNEFITIGVFTNVYPGDYVDWIPTIYGVQIEEWATWTESLNTDLVHYWKLDDGDGTTTAIDETGNANGIKALNIPPNATGKIESAYDFSTKEYMNYSNTLTDINIRTSPLSINLWIKLTSADNYANHITSGFDSAGGWALVTRENDIMQITKPGVTTDGCSTGNNVLVKGAWSMVTMVSFGNGTNEIWVNGTRICTGTLTQDYNSASSFGNIGSHAINLEAVQDEVAVWTRALSGSEIIYIYDNYNGTTFQTLSSDYPPTITLNSPSSANYSSSQSITLNYSVFDDVNLSDVKLYVNDVLNQTNATGINNTNYIFNLNLGNGDYTIYANATDNESQETQSDSIRIVIDSVNPTLTLNTNISNTTTLSIPINVTLNYSASDSYLSTCWYYSTFNATNQTFTCNQTQTISVNSSGEQSIFYFANDTFGNVAQGSTSFYTYYIQRNATATDPVSDGASSTYTLYINLLNVSNFNASAELIFNGTSQGLGTKTVLDNDTIRFDKTIIIPDLNTSSVDYVWYYNITEASVTNYNVTGNQTYIVIDSIECGAGTTTILNYTLYDQQTKALSSGVNASFEIDMNLTSYVNSSQTWQYHAHLTDTYNFPICLPSGVLNTSSFELNSIAKYSYQDYVVQYSYIVNFNLSNDSIPQEIDLYSLTEADSTSFLAYYQDENYIYVENAIIDVWRRYIGDGNFLSVEQGKTDANGQTRLHFETEDILYKFLVWKDGVLLYTSPEFLALCQATPCQINLKKATEEENSYSERDNIVYDYDFNESTRTATFTFSTVDDTETTINMTILSSNQYENDTACTNSLTANGGAIDCIIPLAYTNTSYQVLVYKDGEFFGQAFDSLSPSSSEIFGYTGLVLTAFAYLMLSLMGISSGIATVVFGIIGLILLTLVQLFEGGSIIGLGSAIVWLIIGAIIIIYKITKRRIQ